MRSRTAIGAAIVALAACTVSGGPAPVREAMLTHFDLAAELRESALMGDLAGVRRGSARLADVERPPDLGPEHQRGYVPLTRAARAAGLTTSADEAARATAEVARACADCHVAAGVGLGDLLSVEPAPAVGRAAAHAPELGRAASLLWNGVAAPSERLWRAGAEALAASGPIPAALTRGLAPAYVTDVERRLQQLAVEAAGADAEQRADLLGEIWATCADCHTRS